jgi:hypothetical protein
MLKRVYLRPRAADYLSPVRGQCMFWEKRFFQIIKSVKNAMLLDETRAEGNKK